MTKRIYFDLDGTLADLYNEKNWLEKLIGEKRNLFRNLKTMHDKNKIINALSQLSAKGYEISVITWTPKNVSDEYIKIVEKEKIEWIKEHFPIITDVHCLAYGTPKQKAKIKKAKEMILVDDNLEVIQNWNTPKQRKSILADENLIDNLLALTN